MSPSTTFNVLVPRQSQAGSHRGGSNSLSGILSTLIPVLVVAVIAFTAFLFLRKKVQRVYEPRSLENLVPQHHQAKRAKGSLFGWITPMKEIKDADILRLHSLDAFLYLRYLKMLAIIAVVGVCITWPVLFPVNATGGGDQSQLDILSFSNVNNPNRYYAHALIAWIFQGFVVYVVTRERRIFVALRQAYFLSPLHALRLSSRTVMFLNVPEDKCTSSSIRETFPQARKIWMVPDCEDLQDVIDDRNKEWQRVEKAQVKLILDVHKKKGSSASPTEMLGKMKQPTHRTKPLIGKKVDTITFSRAEMTRMNQEIEKAQQRLADGKGKMLTATFVEFNNQLDAQSALQFGAKQGRTQFRPRSIGVQPEEIIWKNLGTSYKSRKLKMLGASILVTLMILFWTVPVAFVGVLTNINYLTSEVPFLSFIDDIPPVILGVVTGLLPTILLAVLMALVPIFLRLLAKFAGAATLTEVELKTQNWYFAFQVIQVFLITTFTSGAASVAAQIVRQPTLAVTLLARNLPKASNFYISYFILFGLMMAALQLLNIVPFLLFYVLAMLDKTPRKKYNRWMALQGLGWGSIYPKFTNLGVIAIAYSCIAPLVLGFATIGFTLIYLGFRYNFLFVFGIKVDMKGEAYSRALQQLLTGVYLSTLCLIGLFAIATADSTSAIGPLVLMVVFLVGLIIWQFLTDRAFGPLEQFIPIYRLETNESSTEPAHRVELAEKGEANGDSSDTARDVENDKSNTGKVITTGGPTQNLTGNALSRYAHPYIDRSFEKYKDQMKRWTDSFDQTERYTSEEVEDAYNNPALTAETKPIIWLPRDQIGVSKIMVRENIDAGLQSSDEYAWVNEEGKVEWDHDHIPDCPIYERPVIW